MDDSKNKAFPRTGTSQYGMDLRDYFAAKAISGMLSNPAMYDVLNQSVFDHLSKEAYSIADAMLKQREQPIK